MSRVHLFQKTIVVFAVVVIGVEVFHSTELLVRSQPGVQVAASVGVQAVEQGEELDLVVLR
jgi:hypothetical protein